jgi:CSLREA domain-containing protein
MARLVQRSRRPAPSRPSGRVRLALEPLEERAVPTTFTVTTLADETNINDGLVSLREAITAANGTPGADTIDFQPGPSGTITLSQQLQVIDTVTITGPGAGVVTVSGNNVHRIFEVDDRAPTVLSVAISGLTLTQGNSGTEPGGAILLAGNEAMALSGVVIAGNSAGDDDGGGVFVGAGGRLTLSDTTISDNQAARRGGGVFVTFGALTVENATISRNKAADSGGGIYFLGSGQLVVGNSTISGNSAVNDGGGVLIGIGADDSEILNSTISGNSAGDDGGGIDISSNFAAIRSSTVAFNTANSDNSPSNNSGGGLFVISTAAVLLQSTIVADNAVIAPGTNPDVSGSVTATNSLVESTAGATFLAGSANDILGADPLLGPLAFNGGPTQTHALLAGSPAINHGANPALGSDQRGPGFARVAGGAADIGAFEVQSPLPATEAALQAAVQLIRILQPSGARPAAGAFADLTGDFINDVVLAFKLKNGRLLLLTLDGVDGRILRAFVPFPAKFKAGARVQLITLDLNGDGAPEVVLVIPNAGPGVPSLSAFTAAGRRVL